MLHRDDLGSSARKKSSYVKFIGTRCSGRIRSDMYSIICSFTSVLRMMGNVRMKDASWPGER